MSEGDFHYGQRRLENDLVALEPFDVRISFPREANLYLTRAAKRSCRPFSRNNQNTSGRLHVRFSPGL